ncbi:MAG: hypothetical protein KAR38_02605, partial [Calditrichia bacterium]|nr:hypothetical protein [Calditrichia bacterium]
MQNLKTSKIIIYLILISLFYSCATHKAPRGWLPGPNEMQTEVFGSWLDIKYHPDKNLKGEI